ncbi:VOC family protein [Gloeothece verrucosa]|uniref:Glyoxalase/bleomycin resistance protein/dioxygenase n=1 Tax=Gloeothece verrucosa (strain PCC 7822) TaxID=497965 RepID=E0UF57_GLOV7|nr:VOC family protein [Gloeothece verrucosa]ADN14309.1 Glyoxalase/bleomycin resistance protein/dioxygenase [Gloeothece verrucosa PCC 7822]
MQITRCLHTAILVSDLEKAAHFYSNILGLTQVDRSLKYSGIWYQIGDYQIHLIVDSNLTITHQNEEKWGRNPHFALAVADLEAMKEQLQRYGYPFQMSASGRAALFTQDPDGNIIEISQ